MRRIIMVILSGMLFSLGQASVAKAETGIEVGNIAPDFELETLDGEKAKLSDFRGKPVMLNFWATWCPPCRDEMPDMQQFQENNDVVVLAVNVTDTEMSEKSVTKFIEEFGFTFNVLLDVDGAAANLYRIRPIPTTFMINPDGEISFKTFGAMDYGKMVSEIEKMK